jgi:carboxyl-terminal processing protease
MLHKKTFMKTSFQILFASAALIILQGCSSFFEAEPSNNPEAIFESFWKTFDEEYAVFEERGVDWDDQYTAFRPSVTASTSDDELFALLAQMIEPLDDGHVSLTAPGREIFFANEIRREKIDDELFNTDIIKTNYLEPGYEVGEEESYIYGKIKNENVAYIFFKYVGDNFFILNDFLNTYSDANGYIIDLRHNDGGDFTYCFSEIGRLVDQERFAFRSRTKNGTGDDDYTDWFSWTVKPEGDYIDKSIVVLTDRYTISAGERAVMAFRVLPNVTIVGDTTNGAHSTMIGRELANGWFFSIATQKVELADGHSYEVIGVAPDVVLKNTIDEINAGVDGVLGYAVDQLR